MASQGGTWRMMRVCMRCGMGMKDMLGIRCGVIAWVKHSILRWLGMWKGFQGSSLQRENIRV